MGYDNVEVFFGKHHNEQDVIAGFRFVVPLAQGTQLTSGSLSLYLEEKYPEGIAVLDHFTDTNGTLLTAHTMDVGPASGWFQYSGNMQIQSNQACYAGFYACECNASDGEVKATCLGYANGNSGGAGLVFRLSNAANYWVFYRSFRPYGYEYAELWLYKAVGGSGTQVGYINLSTNPGSADLKVVLDGNSIKCYQGTVLRFDVSDSDLATNTGYGLYHTASGCRSDNFEFIPSGTSGSHSFVVRCEDANNSADFQTGGLPDTRTLTSGSTDLGDISGWAEDDWGTTIDIKEPIQEVLDRPGWVSGNHVSVIVSPLAGCASGERFRVESYDGYPSRAAKLALSW